MNPSPSRRGVALLTALAILVVVGGVAALMFARTLGEIRHSADDTGIVQSLLLARGAANLGGAVLQGPVRDELDAIVQVASSTTSRWSFGTGSASSDAPTPQSVVQVLTTDVNSVANQLQTSIDALLCGATVPGLPDGEQLRLRIHVTATACGVALPGGVALPAGRFVGGLPRDGSGSANDQTYGIPFVIVAEGEVGPYLRNVVTSGEYQFTVGRGSFAQYALFTNIHRSAAGSSGSDVWFTENTLFDGPVHTNQNFRFYRDPWFGGRVTSAGCANPNTNARTCSSGAGSFGAYFYGVNNGNRVPVGSMQPPTSPSYANGFGTHAPQLAAGVDWSSAFVPLPDSNQTQRDAAIAGGIEFPRPLESLVLRATNDVGVTVPADGSVAATRQYVEACYRRNASNVTQNNNLNRRVCQTYEISADGSMRMRERWTSLNGNTVYVDTDFAPVGGFNGVIYVPGGIDRFGGPDRTVAANPASASPALASFAQITVAASGDITITRDLKYEDVPCSGTPTRVAGAVVPATCDDLAAQNVLGVYSQGGDVLIGHNNTGNGSAAFNAPQDVTIHGILMSSTGVVGVENYDSGGARGAVNLIGGVIENFYGPFGTFNANNGQMSTGYSRAFTFDQRMGAGLAPPFFPTTGDDEVTNVLAFAYAQREQVE